jgi:hypothetical protein
MPAQLSPGAAASAGELREEAKEFRDTGKQAG